MIIASSHCMSKVGIEANQLILLAIRNISHTEVNSTFWVWNSFSLAKAYHSFKKAK